MTKTMTKTKTKTRPRPIDLAALDMAARDLDDAALDLIRDDARQAVAGLVETTPAAYARRLATWLSGRGIASAAQTAIGITWALMGTEWEMEEALATARPNRKGGTAYEAV